MQKKYAQAVAVASGRHMDAIVVDSKAVAAECINYLKDQRVGSCLFLPLGKRLSVTSLYSTAAGSLLVFTMSN